MRLTNWIGIVAALTLMATLTACKKEPSTPETAQLAIGKPETTQAVVSKPTVAPAVVVPRYIFVNKAPGIDWNQAKPETFTRRSLDEIKNAMNVPENPALRVGAAFFFSILETDPDTLVKSVRALLRASEDSGVPVMVTLDGQQWWATRPDLWNWWDPKRPGYNPENVNNVEWTGWTPTMAVKIGWRNWGNQLRVCPAPNIASPRFVQANLERLDLIVPVIAAWYRDLPKEKKYLLGAVKVGNEAGTGYNAFYYPDGNRYLEQWPNDPSHDPQTGLKLAQGLSGGVAQIGYAAVKTVGIRSQGEITRDDIGKATQQYLAALAERTHRQGIPEGLIYAHQGGTYPPWGTHLPFSAAFNRWSRPCWSFYWLDPKTCGDLGEQLGDKPWAAGEWWWPGSSAREWEDHLERTLRFGNCRMIGIYNWDCVLELRKDQAGIQAIRNLVGRWRD